MDPILKYYIIYQLVKQDALSLINNYKFDFLNGQQQFMYKLCGRSVDIEEEGYEIIPEVKQYYDTLLLPSNSLKALTKLTIIGGQFNVYETDIHPHWQYGDDKATTVNSLNGIENCTNLQTLDLECIADTIDLTPLNNLTQLTYIKICITNNTNLNPLLGQKSLKHLKIEGAVNEEKSPIWPKNKQVLSELENNGIKVEKSFYFTERRFF